MGGRCVIRATRLFQLLVDQPSTLASMGSLLLASIGGRGGWSAEPPTPILLDYIGRGMLGIGAVPGGPGTAVNIVSVAERADPLSERSV